MSDNKVAVITGANRGIGLEIARQLARDYQFHVVLGARDGKKGNQAAEELIGENLKASFFPLDILAEESVRTKDLRPFLSIVSPAKRPGICRTNFSRVAKNPT